MMLTLEKYLDEICRNEAYTEKFKCTMQDIFCHIKEHDEKHYHKYMCKLHELIYGCHFNEDIACKAVASMENVDGSVGAHWNIIDTTKFADQYSLNKYDFYYVMNMLYSDFSTAIGSATAELYAKMAKAYIEDKDAKDGKAFKLYLAGHN